jgi:RND family efflux transporter MFP subunit
VSEGEHESIQPESPAPAGRERPVRPGIVFYLLLLLLTAGVGVALYSVMTARDARLQAQEVAMVKEASAGFPVRVTRPRMSGESLEMLLPGDLRAYLESPIYAKVSGYLKKLNVDKGDRVEQGQLLALLENPEAEQEYRTARANYDIAKITNDRNQDLVRDHTIAQQAADRSRADFLIAQSNLQRLKILVDYEQLRAPFSGVVVARNYDPGVLVPAATTSTASTSVPVLVVAKVDRLRVYLYVPQSDASFVRVGDPAQITFDEFPGRVFAGRVSRFSRALDPGTRTMLTEVDLPNDRQTLMPGMYAQVRLKRKQPKAYPIVPDEALVFRNEKVFVPLVTADKRIHLQPVTLGADNGTEVQVTAGLAGDEMIALGVGQTVSEGLRVQPVTPKQPAGAAPGGPPAAKPAAAPAAPAAPDKPAAMAPAAPAGSPKAAVPAAPGASPAPAAAKVAPAKPAPHK